MVLELNYISQKASVLFSGLCLNASLFSQSYNFLLRFNFDVFVIFYIKLILQGLI
jgi:hypothetical protein